MPAALGQSPMGQAYSQGLQVLLAAGSGGHSHRRPGTSRGWECPLQACPITQENQAIKAQLSQLTELVWQLLPQPGQATPQPAGAGNTQVLSLPVVDQAASTSGVEVSLPPPLWPHTRDQALGVSPGDHQLLLPSHTGQHSALPHGNPLPAVPAALASPARQMAATDAQLQQPRSSLASPGTLVLGSASSPQQVSSATGLPPAQVPASL